VPQVDAVDLHGALLWIVKPQQQLEHRRLAGARRARRGDLLAGSHVETEAVERRPTRPRRIVEAHVFEGRASARRMSSESGCSGCAYLGLDAEELEQALGGAGRALHVADHFADRPDRAATIAA
jgi:hypothetical protein